MSTIDNRHPAYRRACCQVRPLTRTVNDPDPESRTVWAVCDDPVHDDRWFVFNPQDAADKDFDAFVRDLGLGD